MENSKALNFQGGTTLLSEPFKVRKEAVDKAAPVAQQVAARIAQIYREKKACLEVERTD